MRRCGAFAYLGVLGLGVLVADMPAARANGTDQPWRLASDRPIQFYELSAGADAQPAFWSVYGSATAAIFGDIRSDGLRLRAAAGFGEYRYSRPYHDPAVGLKVDAPFRGRHTWVDTLVGYHMSFGPMTAKLFGGYTETDHAVRGAPGSPLALDADNRDQGSRRGAKVVLETWTRLQDWGFVQVDASWSQPLDAASARARLGLRLGSSWSTGLEVAAFGSPVPDQGRVGGFLRLEWERGEISISAGAAGTPDSVDGGYGTVSAAFRF